MSLTQTNSIQEPTLISPTHKDYLPDVTGPDPEGDYEQEEDDQGGPEEEYDDYQENLHQMDQKINITQNCTKQNYDWVVI